MKKLLLVIMIFTLTSSAYAMCPRMAGCRGNQNCRRMTEYENKNECPKEVFGYYIASISNCYDNESPFK